MRYEIRWHGRAGQGVVTVSRLLAYAALLDGKHVQAFPEFGPERLGAPVQGFTRIADEPIEIHSQVYEPDLVVVLDPTLLKIVNVIQGLKRDGGVVINSKEEPSTLRRQLGLSGGKVYSVNATRIALDIIGKPVYNTAMLGALVKIAPLAKLDSVIKAVLERFRGAVGEKNVEVIKRAYSEVRGD